MAKIRTVNRDRAGRFAKQGSGTAMALRMPSTIRNSTGKSPVRSNRAIRAARKKRT